MKKDEFAHSLLDLWVTTAIPLTQANLQYHTGASRRKIRAWTEQMVREGELEFDSDDHGEFLFTVPGARRPADGPRSFAEQTRLDGLRADVASAAARKRAHKERLLAKARARASRDSGALVPTQDEPRSLSRRLRDRYDAGTALSIASNTRRELESGRASGDKSLAVSGVLSLFFGPLGWLYAGSFREAIPASLAFLVIVNLLPSFLLFPIAGIAMPLSGIAGLVYAWQHNRSGRRTPILGDDAESS